MWYNVHSPKINVQKISFPGTSLLKNTVLVKHDANAGTGTGKIKYYRLLACHLSTNMQVLNCKKTSALSQALVYRK